MARKQYSLSFQPHYLLLKSMYQKPSPYRILSSKEGMCLVPSSLLPGTRILSRYLFSENISPSSPLITYTLRRTAHQAPKTYISSMTGQSRWCIPIFNRVIPEIWAARTEFCLLKLNATLAHTLPSGFSNTITLSSPHHVAELDPAGLPHAEPKATEDEEESGEAYGYSNL